MAFQYILAWTTKSEIFLVSQKVKFLTNCDFSKVMLIEENGGKVNHRCGDIIETQTCTAESDFLCFDFLKHCFWGGLQRELFYYMKIFWRLWWVSAAFPWTLGAPRATINLSVELGRHWLFELVEPADLPGEEGFCPWTYTVSLTMYHFRNLG